MKTPQELQHLYRDQKDEFDQKRKDLTDQSIKHVEQNFIEQSNEVWAYSDCLKCANCCKTISPIIEFNDIHRMANHLKIQAGEFMDQYIEMDEDGDYVFKSQPCPMLNLDDNKCKVYESRPRACSEYPHLDQVNSKSMIDLAFTNAKYCGVVFDTIKKVD